jgi:transcriptional regulator with XRE-family HTH domain
MTESSEVLRDVMLETGTTQSDLARISGVRQPTISQILTGRLGVSDEQLQRLLSCMGFELEVVRRPVRPTLTRSEMRSWRLHRLVSSRLTRDSLRVWTPTLRRNLLLLGAGVRGEPHVSNLGKWTHLIDEGDVLRLHRVLMGLDRRSIEMREVSPFGGILTQAERQQALLEAS